MVLNLKAPRHNEQCKKASDKKSHPHNVRKQHCIREPKKPTDNEKMAKVIFPLFGIQDLIPIQF